MIVATSLVTASSVRARVTVVQSSRRTLIAMLRPRRPRRTSPSASSRDISRIAVSIWATSEMSSSKVRSLDRDLAAPGSVETSDSSSNAARAFKKRPVLLPKRAASRPSSACCRWPSVWIPRSASRSAVFGPMPGTRLVGAVAKRTHASSRPMATKPFGLPRSLQHLATSRDGPMPTEITIPVPALTASTTSRSTRSGLATPVRSAYASSRPSCCTRSSRSATTSQTRLDVSR